MTVRPMVLSEVLRRARAGAFAPREFVGQESFVSASEVLGLASRAHVGAGVRVLDLCCGRAGPGLHIVRSLGCDYLGVDASLESIEDARRHAADLGLQARFEVARVPPLPPGEFAVVLLLETLLAFPDKASLLHVIGRALGAGGRLGCTVEEGAPLTDAERAVMPAPDSVWPIPLDELLADLGAEGMRVEWVGERTEAHRAVVQDLIRAYERSAEHICAAGGSEVLADLLASHRLWDRWLGERRIRKFALVAEKVG